MYAEENLGNLNMNKSTDTIIEHGTGLGISNTDVHDMTSFEDRDIKPEAFDYARVNCAFLSEGWGG
jgi:hypothetical protein